MNAKTTHAASASALGDLPFGLLDEETGNFVGFFGSEEAALATVLDTLDRYGPAGVASLALARFVGNDVEAIASGPSLAKRARATHAGPKPERNGAPATAPSAADTANR
jgi:hypothetical protein